MIKEVYSKEARSLNLNYSNLSSTVTWVPPPVSSYSIIFLKGYLSYWNKALPTLVGSHLNSLPLP